MIENIFGSEAWYALKESNHLPTWKKQLAKVVCAIHLSIQASVEIYDQDWMMEINQAVDLGKARIKESTDIEEAISSLAATFINISFLQVGLMPNRQGSSSKIPFRKENWKLSQYRTVIYFQNNQQKEQQFYSKQQKEIGHQKQLELKSAHRRSESNLSYSEWCLKHAHGDLEKSDSC
jgi:hypothetical protein